MLDHHSTADRFRALADPTRLALYERLTEGPAPVSELAAPFDMSLTAVGQHLAILEGAGLIRSEKSGRIRTCECVPEAIESLEKWIHARRRHIGRQLDRLGEVLDQLHPVTGGGRQRRSGSADKNPQGKKTKRTT